MKLLALLEHNTGGEHIATQQLFSALELLQIGTVKISLPALQHTSMLSFLSWIVTGICVSIRKSWKHRDIQYVYCTTFLGAAGAILLRSFTHQHVLFHYHGNRMPNYPEHELPLLKRSSQWVKYQMSHALHCFAFSQADVLFVPSSRAFSLLKSAFPRCSFAKTVLVPNGVDVQKFQPVTPSQQETLRKSLHIPKSSFVCLLISRLNEEKRILESIDLIAALHRFSRQRVLLILAFPRQGNDEAYAARIQDKLTQLQVPHLALQGHSHIEHLYQVSDCVLSHSIREVFPLSLLEAAACGIPFFAVPNGITEQYLAEIDSELILPTSDQLAVRQVLSGTHRRKLNEKLKAYASQHSWRAAAVIVSKTVSELD